MPYVETTRDKVTVGLEGGLHAPSGGSGVEPRYFIKGILDISLY